MAKNFTGSKLVCEIQSKLDKIDATGSNGVGTPAYREADAFIREQEKIIKSGKIHFSSADIKTLLLLEQTDAGSVITSSGFTISCVQSLKPSVAQSATFDFLTQVEDRRKRGDFGGMPYFLHPIMHLIQSKPEGFVPETAKRLDVLLLNERVMYEMAFNKHLLEAGSGIYYAYPDVPHIYLAAALETALPTIEKFAASSNYSDTCLAAGLSLFEHGISDHYRYEPVFRLETLTRITALAIHSPDEKTRGKAAKIVERITVGGGIVGQKQLKKDFC